MQLHEIFLSILDKPHIPRFYRELQNFYNDAKMYDESSAIVFLIENKFGKKNENPSEYTNFDEGQSGND